MQQNSPEWLEFRRSKIGASDAPIIMEVSPWTTPYQLWETKVGLREDNAPNRAMQRGTEMEEEARAKFCQMMGIEVKPQVLISKDYPWMIASLDGQSDDKTVIVEIKCPGAYDHAKAMAGEVPDKYYPQLQHQMAVAELEEAYYFSYTKLSWKAVKVQRDESYIARMINKEKEFYRCMTDFVAPAYVDRDFVKREDHDWISLAQQYQAAQRAAREAEEQEEKLRQALIQLAGNRNTQGAGVKIARVIRRGNVDYKAVPELAGVNLDIYRRAPVESWRINLSSEK